MNDGHQGMHVGLAPGCRMWTPILPVSALAVPPVGVVTEKSGRRSLIDDGVPAAMGGVDKNVQKT